MADPSGRDANTVLVDRFTETSVMQSLLNGMGQSFRFKAGS
jgi:hypothetical protein